MLHQILFWVSISIKHILRQLCMLIYDLWFGCLPDRMRAHPQDISIDYVSDLQHQTKISKWLAMRTIAVSGGEVHGRKELRNHGVGIKK